jgi:hypothetical protein
VETLTCVTAFRNGETQVECSTRKHRLALRDIAPDLGVKFTPVVSASSIEYVLNSVAGQGS